MRVRMVLATALVFVIAVAVGSTTNSPSDSSLAELIEAVEAARAQIQEIDIEYSFDAVAPGAGAIVTDTRHLRWVAGKMVLDRSYGTAEQSWQRRAGFDGEVWWWRTGGGVAITGNPEDQDTRVVDTEGSGFTDLMLWYPCHEVRFGSWHPRDLRNILQQPHTVLRSDMEPVGDALCHVIDLINPSTGEPWATFWIDPERGYLPILRESASGTAFRIDDAVEAAPGVWIPTAGVRLTGAGVAPEMPNATEYELEVHQWHVNHGGLVAAEFEFEFAADLAPGSPVFDLDNEQIWTTSTEDYGEGADAALARLPGLEMLATGGAEKGAADAPWKDPWWAGLLIIACVFSAGCRGL